MTLHQLRIFMAVAQSSTLTRASKQLGTRLFDRSHNRMVLTDAGQVLMRHAQTVLKEIEEAEANLARFGTGKRSIIRIAGLNSVIKAVLPDALTRCAASGSDIEIDIHEAAPAEVLEMLYSRQANVGLIAADSVAQSSVGFRQIPVVDDPYVFAVPSALRLAKVRSLDALSDEARRILNSCIQFHFGTPHTLRIQQWYQQVLPEHRVVAHCRTYEVALGLVHAGFGVCLLPALTAFLVEGALDGIDFFATDHGTRHTVAMVADQYLRIAPYKEFVAALQAAGRGIVLPPIKPWPAVMGAATRKDESNLVS
jgi:DNA-binding transcriptional LysR family regulator